MRSLRAVYFVNGIAWGLLYNWIPVILEAKGFDAALIGLTAGLGAIGFTIALPLWGHLGDMVSGPRRALQIALVPAALASLGYVLPLPTPLVVLCSVAVMACGGPAIALTDAMAVSVLADPAREYSGLRLTASVGAGLGGIGCGFLYSVTGTWLAPLLFIVSVPFALVAAGFVPIGRGEAERSSARESGLAHAGGRLGSAGAAFRLAPRLAAILAAVVVLYIPITIASTYGTLRLADLGSGSVAVGFLNGGSSLTEIPGLLIGGWVVGRYGVRAALVTAGLLVPFCVGSWVFLTDPVAMIATRVLVGGCSAAIIVPLVVSVAAILPDRLVSTGQTLLAAASWGVAALIGNVMGGVLYGSTGAAGTFGMAAVLAVFGALLVGASLPRWVGVRRADGPRGGGARDVAVGDAPLPDEPAAAG